MDKEKIAQVSFVNDVEKFREIIESPQAKIFKNYLNSLRNNLQSELIGLKAKTADEFLQRASYLQGQIELLDLILNVPGEFIKLVNKVKEKIK